MGLGTFSRALLVKLFYQNNNSAAALREYRRIKEYGEVLFPYRHFTTLFIVETSSDQRENELPDHHGASGL